MPAAAKKDSLLLSFAPSEAKHAVSRNAVKALRDLLGFSNETQVIQYALASLRDQMMPRYEADNGLPPKKMLGHIRKSVSQSTEGGKSLL